MKDVYKKILLAAAIVFIAVNIFTYIGSDLLNNTELNTFRDFLTENILSFNVSTSIQSIVHISIGLPFTYINVEDNILYVYILPLLVDVVVWVLVCFLLISGLKPLMQKNNPLKKDINLLVKLSRDKHTQLGMLLILYAMFLTPAYFEPSDLAISTGWLTLVATMFPSNLYWIVPIWMWTGYVAVILGAMIIGKRLLKHFGLIGEEIYVNPFTAFALISLLSAIIVIILFNMTGVKLW